MVSYCFRPEGHMETSDINFWLESWIPLILGIKTLETKMNIKKISLGW